MNHEKTVEEVTSGTVAEMVKDFVTSEAYKREIYLWQDENLWLKLPNGKVVRITLDFVSEAKLNNKAE